MQRREDTLLEALRTNAYEAERWLQYIRENEIALENLTYMPQHLTLNVMVPFGRKLLMRGVIVHTNEVMVGHFQGYFSKCTAHQAKEICKYRIQNGQEYLKKFKAEEKLWQNSLEIPKKYNVLEMEDKKEIIEAYDEEQEEKWRVLHKSNVKKHKMKEKIERQAQDALITDDALDLLDERQQIENDLLHHNVTHQAQEPNIISQQQKQQYENFERSGTANHITPIEHKNDSEYLARKVQPEFLQYQKKDESEIQKNESKQQNQRRSISFGAPEQILEFNMNDCVSNMIPKFKKNIKDGEIDCEKLDIPDNDNQSQKSIYLTDKNVNNTAAPFHITFRHSKELNFMQKGEFYRDDKSFYTPFHFYKQYVQQTENELVSNECDDNNYDVEHELHVAANNSLLNTAKNNKQNITHKQVIVGDVKERDLLQTSASTDQCSHTSKKRISRFRQMRNTHN